MPQVLQTKACIVATFDIVSAAVALASAGALSIGQSSAAKLPLLDVLIAAVPKTANGIASVVTACKDLTADAMAQDMGVQQLARDSIADEPPAVDILCPPATLAKWSAQTPRIPLAAVPSHQQAAQEQLLRAADPHTGDPVTKCKPHAGMVVARSTAMEPAVEQLELVPISTALAEGPPQLAIVLADLGGPCEDAAGRTSVDPLSIVPPGGLTFEHFAALDLCLDRTQPSTLPLPEDDDTVVAPQGAILV